MLELILGTLFKEEQSSIRENTRWTASQCLCLFKAKCTVILKVLQEIGTHKGAERPFFYSITKFDFLVMMVC